MQFCRWTLIHATTCDSLMIMLIQILWWIREVIDLIKPDQVEVIQKAGAKKLKIETDKGNVYKMQQPVVLKTCFWVLMEWVHFHRINEFHTLESCKGFIGSSLSNPVLSVYRAGHWTFDLPKVSRSCLLSDNLFPTFIVSEFSVLIHRKTPLFWPMWLVGS